jgi:hypothetical protein
MTQSSIPEVGVIPDEYPPRFEEAELTDLCVRGYTEIEYFDVTVRVLNSYIIYCKA